MKLIIQCIELKMTENAALVSSITLSCIITNSILPRNHHQMNRMQVLYSYLHLNFDFYGQK